jgi:hypothetical protein
VPGGRFSRPPRPRVGRSTARSPACACPPSVRSWRRRPLPRGCA